MTTQSKVITPKVSVVIPVFNMSAHLAAAIEGVLAQTFADWEAWIVEDGSRDSSPDIAKRYAASHPQQIHYLEHEGHANRGVSASRNLALDHARGELVAFLDADDLWAAEKLDKQVGVFQSHPEVGLVYSSARLIREDGSPWSPQDGPAPVKIATGPGGEPRLGYGPANTPTELFEELVRHCCLVNSAVMIRRSVLKEAGRFDESMSYAEDWLLYTCVAYRTCCYFIDEPLASYRVHPGHFSASLQGDDLARLRGTATFLRKLPAELGITDGKVKRLIEENRRILFGRALTSAETAWHARKWNEAVTLAQFAYRTYPSLFLSRRTARFLRNILCGL